MQRIDDLDNDQVDLMIIIMSSVKDLDVKESYILKLGCKVFVFYFSEEMNLHLQL